MVLAVVALVLSYAGRSVLSAPRFADRAVATLRDPAVQDDVADHLTDALVNSSAGGDLVAVRPLIRSVAGGVVGSQAFEALFRRGVIEAHRALVGDMNSPVVLTVADAGVLIQGVLQRFSPGTATKLGTDRLARLLSTQPSGVVHAVVRIANAVYVVAWALLVLALLLAAVALQLSADRSATTVRMGRGLVAGGILLVALYLIGGALAQHAASAGRGPVAGAVWRAFLGGLSTQALWMAGAGAVVSAAASVRQSSHAAGASASWTARVANAPPRARLALSLLVVAAGFLLLLEPAATLRLLAVILGLGLVYRGALEALRSIPAARDEGMRDADNRSGQRRGLARAPQPSARGLAVAAPVAIGLIALVLAIVVVGTGGGDEAPAAVPVTCNGYAVLCNRRLDAVVFPATHNSMASVTIPSWLFGQQDGTVDDQLAFGIRGFLIDTYYGFPTGNRVRTDLQSLPKREAAVSELGAPAVKAAESIRNRLGTATEGPRAIYLCHGFCELGAVTLSSVLTGLRSFLISNPGEVVVLINQDEGVTPSDIERAFDKAGLLDLVYRGPLGPFPTLGQMVASGQRVVVMAENDAGSVPWYHLAYQHTLQETPFRFTASKQLAARGELASSCRSNRGPNSAPLFLLNHWIDTTPTPRASNADVVNAYEPLLRRAQTCERQRHRLPNLIAVDFFRRGNVLRVARTLNGTG